MKNFKIINKINWNEILNIKVSLLDVSYLLQITFFCNTSVKLSHCFLPTTSSVPTLTLCQFFQPILSQPLSHSTNQYYILRIFLHVSVLQFL